MTGYSHCYCQIILPLSGIISSALFSISVYGIRIAPWLEKRVKVAIPNFRALDKALKDFLPQNFLRFVF